LEDKCCIRTVIKNGTELENVNICATNNNVTACSYSALLLAKKYAVDCSRFKDPKNDMISLNELNYSMINE